jgi:hypothetical protein
MSGYLSSEAKEARMMMSLSEALAQNRLPDFIAQEEARGIGPINKADYDAAAEALIKAPQSKGRTSRSSSGDGSSGKKTRQGSDPCASG